MKKSILIFLSLSILGTSCVKEMQEGGSNPENQPHQSKMTGDLHGEKTEGELLVKLSENAVRSLAEGTFDSAGLFGGLGDASLVPVFPGSEDDGTTARHSLYKWHKLSFNRSISPEKAAEIIAGHPEIEVIQYNSIIRTDQCPESVEYVPEVATKSTRASDLPFNDRGLGTQWNLINDGSIAGAVAGADVGVKDAWRLTAGDPRVIVAVFDQGIAHTHPDLEKAMWRNTREINGKAGVDDDKNGYVDDKYGYNFVTGNGTLTFAKGTPDHPGDHGTHVAGTIAAVNNNGIGVSSIAGGSGKGDGVRLMSCQISPTTNGFATAENVAKAFKYAADMGACIAQCSFGDTDYESVVQEALRYFIDPANSNCAALETNIIVFSAGNYNTSRSLYPGAWPECISVTAMCHDFLPAGYTNYGAGCDIAAPGGDVVRGDNKAPCMILSTGIGGEYGDESLTWVYKYGTSMACPHVSGVVALGASYALELGKKFSRDGFISRLLTSAKDIDSYNTGNIRKLMYDGGYKEIDISVKKGMMGTGAVDAWNFLMALEGTPSLLTVPGKVLTIDLADYVGASYEKYSLIVPPETADALGLSGTSGITDGKLELICTRTGAGKILLKASVGKDASGNIPELDYNMEISIVSRPAVAQNGGWL